MCHPERFYAQFRPVRVISSDQKLEGPLFYFRVSPWLFFSRRLALAWLGVLSVFLCCYVTTVQGLNVFRYGFLVGGPVRSRDCVPRVVPIIFEGVTCMRCNVTCFIFISASGLGIVCIRVHYGFVYLQCGLILFFLCIHDLLLLVFFSSFFLYLLGGFWFLATVVTLPVEVIFVFFRVRALFNSAVIFVRCAGYGDTLIIEVITGSGC